jgi:hypothetical protein
VNSHPVFLVLLNLNVLFDASFGVNTLFLDCLLHIAKHSSPLKSDFKKENVTRGGGGSEKCQKSVTFYLNVPKERRPGQCYKL